MSLNFQLRYPLALAALVGSAFVGTVPSASAADVCPPDLGNQPPVCVYDGSDFTGLLDNRTAWRPNLPAGQDNKISSVINETRYKVLFFADPNYRGDTIEIGPGERWVAPPEWDNRISGYVMY
ncbi:peptidase inhibitor family I36 protein [Streptomyces sp. CHD11]|uniref:peptidase inhibitor family I36 protein n=1 Tax=Streptomyces sp. CHD11 TaxID=2741325 RepID=UPI001BFC3885|nr:peptidase inhibitor family I36 protein [Streptomyces sp. CHD11]MBT3150433.1 peptidase inhibitor family I36 protein [Streptomyces sp. CHD11]